MELEDLNRAKRFLSDPITDTFDITPSDDVDLDDYAVGLFASADCTARVTMAGGHVVSLPLSKGINSIVVQKVWFTGTDADVTFQGGKW